MEEHFVVSLVRDEHSFALSFYPLDLQFFVFCNNSGCFLCNSYHPKLGTRVHLITRYEAFKEVNFTVFFKMCNGYVTSFSSLIK
jgi:hypothetical protein